MRRIRSYCPTLSTSVQNPKNQTPNKVPPGFFFSEIFPNRVLDIENWVASQKLRRFTFVRTKLVGPGGPPNAIRGVGGLPLMPPPPGMYGKWVGPTISMDGSLSSYLFVSRVPSTSHSTNAEKNQFPKHSLFVPQKCLTFKPVLLIIHLHFPPKKYCGTKSKNPIGYLSDSIPIRCPVRQLRRKPSRGGISYKVARWGTGFGEG